MNKRTKDFILIILGVVGAFFLIQFLFGNWGQALISAVVFFIGYVVGKKNPDN
jgi:uncharacterized membrane protein YeaQ/YmgE (transglycosylase-associated protein family)